MPRIASYQQGFDYAVEGSGNDPSIGPVDTSNQSHIAVTSHDPLDRDQPDGRDPCVRCGVRGERHAEMGCKRWTKAR